jgi:hypothetical protein
MASNPTTIVSVPYPQGERPHLRIAIGPCRLRIAGGAADTFVTGGYDDPTALLPLQVTQRGDQVTISQSTHLGSIGKLTQAPTLDLQLGAARPFELTIEGGANETTLELGGLPVARLAIRQGAGRSTVDFATPNPTEMSVLDVASGGVAIEMRDLANANFAEMTIAGGAASYQLRFGGELRRDAEVRLNTGVSSVDIGVPATTPSRISSQSVVGGLDVGDGFVTREGAFLTEAAAAGGSPSLRIAVVSMFGAVRIRTT